MRGTTSEVVGLLASIVTVGLIVAVISRGSKTAQVVNALGNQFGNALRIATGQVSGHHN